MFKVNNRSTRCYFDVFIANFEYIWHVVLVCLMSDEILYCLNLSLPMHFRFGSSSVVTFKTELYVNTVNNSFQSLSISRHKKLHVRFCIGLELNSVTWSTKIRKGIEGHSHTPTPPPQTHARTHAHTLSNATLGKYEKLTLLVALKIHFESSLRSQIHWLN